MGALGRSLWLAFLNVSRRPRDTFSFFFIPFSLLAIACSTQIGVVGGHHGILEGERYELRRTEGYPYIASFRQWRHVDYFSSCPSQLEGTDCTRKGPAPKIAFLCFLFSILDCFFCLLRKRALLQNAPTKIRYEETSRHSTWKKQKEKKRRQVCPFPV